METSRLSICIPTFNRADLLKENMLELIGIIKNYKIPIYISNNCSTDQTELTVLDLKGQYEYIHYFKQNKNIHDENFPFILRQSSTEYAWLLGDKNRIKAEWIPKILEIIGQNSFDAVVVNTLGLRVKDIPSQVYSNHNSLLVDLGWHMTLISSLIFSRALISEIDFERYKNTNFMHIAGIFEAIANREFRILWVNEPIILNPRTLPKSGSGWAKYTFNIFIDIWANSILALPPIYTIESKLKCIKKHGVESGLFAVISFLALRKINIYNFSIFRKYRKYFHYLTNVPNSILFLISITPKIILRFSSMIRRMTKGALPLYCQRSFRKWVG